MCFVGLRSGLCVGRSSSFTSNLLIHVFMDLSLSHGGQYCWDRKGPSYNCYCSVDQYKLSEAGNSASNHMLKSSSQNADVLALLHCSDVFPKDIQSLSVTADDVCESKIPIFVHSNMVYIIFILIKLLRAGQKCVTVG